MNVTAHATRPPMTTTRVIFRFLAGRPLDGIARTDCTYLQPGTRPVTLTGRASRWAYLPGWKRQLARLGPLPCAAAVFAAWQAQPELVTLAGGGMGLAAVVKGLAFARQRFTTRRFRRIYTRPLARAIAPIVSLPEHTNPDRWLHISPDLGNLATRLARPMTPFEVWLRATYAQHLSPVIWYVPERVTRANWWLRGKLAPLQPAVDFFRLPAEAAGPPRVQLRIPTGYVSAEQQTKIRQAVSTKLPLGELEESWDQVGRDAVGVFTLRKRPPAFVGVQDLLDCIDALAEHEFFLGRTIDERKVVVSLDDDAPHVACSAGSGAGKSVLAQLMAVQVLRRGGKVIILDRKGSHRWALGMPGVTYCTRAEQMHEVLIETAEEADRRNAAALEVPDEELDTWVPGQRIFVIFEEMNATAAQLKAYWENVRMKDEPKTSPAIQAFRNLMFMGRSAWVNVFAVAQMLTATTTGGPEARENFGIRALARYTANNWRMLAPECAMPRKSKTRGRWQIVISGEATETQVAYLSAREARLVATSGTSPDSTSPVSPATTFDQASPAAPAETSGTAAEPSITTVIDPLGDPVTLRQAVDMGILSGNFDAVKKRLQRTKKNHPSLVPQAMGKRGMATLYRVADLIEWAEKIEKRGEFERL